MTLTKKQLEEINRQVRLIDERHARMNFVVGDLIEIHDHPDIECWPHFFGVFNIGDRFLIVKYVEGRDAKQYQVYDLTRNKKEWFDKDMTDDYFKKLK